MLSQLFFMGICYNSSDICVFTIPGGCEKECNFAFECTSGAPCGFLDSSCPWTDASANGFDCEDWNSGSPSQKDQIAAIMYCSVFLFLTFFLGSTSSIATLVNGAPDDEEGEKRGDEEDSG